MNHFFKTLYSSLPLFLTLFLSLPCQTSFATTDLITNGDFELGRANWNFVNSFFIFTNSASARSGSRYAYVGADSSGTKTNNIGGEMYQQFTIPAGATSVTCSWWYYITSDDTGSVKNDIVISSLKTTSGSVRAYLQTNSNLDRVASKNYQQSTIWQLNILAGETLRLSFFGTNNSSSPTVFRIEDVSIVAVVPPSSFTLSVAPSCYGSGASRTPEVYLSWNASVGATSYDIYRNGNYYTSTTTTHFDNTAVSIGSTYSYYIKAINADGTSNSNTNSITVPANVCPQSPSLASPGGTSAPGSPIADFTPTLVWNGVTGATGYGVYVSAYPYGQANQVYASNIFTTATSNTIPSGVLQPNTEYRWKATSFYGDIESDPSDALYIRTPVAPTIPVAPSGLTASSIANGISLVWQDNSGDETGFIVQRRQGTTYTSFSASANQTDYLDTTASQFIQYCYTVRATSGAGDSAQTSEACATYTPSGPNPVAIIAGNLTPVTGTTTYYGKYSTGSTPLQFSWTTSDEGGSDVLRSATR